MPRQLEMFHLRRLAFLRRPAIRRTAGTRAGFSIIELLIVLVMVGILMSVAILRTATQTGRTRVQRAATVIAIDLQYAQLQAVRQRTPIVVVVDPAVKGYLIRDRDTPNVHRERLLGPGTEFALDLLTVAPGDVEFFPNGVTKGSTTFTMGKDGYQREVRLTRAGQIRIQYGS